MADEVNGQPEEGNAVVLETDRAERVESVAHLEAGGPVEVPAFPDHVAESSNIAARFDYTART